MSLLLNMKIKFNETLFIPSKVKTEIQIVSLEHGLFSQIVRIRRKVANAKQLPRKEAFISLPRSVRSDKKMFKMEHSWMIETFRTRELEFYERLYQKKHLGQDNLLGKKICAYW